MDLPDALDDVAAPLFPKTSLIKQKPAMRHHMLKPTKMPITLY